MIDLGQKEAIMDQIHMRFDIEQEKALLEKSELSISNYLL